MAVHFACKVDGIGLLEESAFRKIRHNLRVTLMLLITKELIFRLFMDIGQENIRLREHVKKIVYVILVHGGYRRFTYNKHVFLSNCIQISLIWFPLSEFQMLVLQVFSVSCHFDGKTIW